MKALAVWILLLLCRTSVAALDKLIQRKHRKETP